MNHVPTLTDGRSWGVGEREGLIEPMVNYDVDTDPRKTVYSVLTAVSILGAAPIAALILTAFSSTPIHLGKYSLGTVGAAFASLVTPVVVFGIIWWPFNKLLWRVWPFTWFSGITYIGGTWQGTLTRISACQPQPETTCVKCYITQYWRRIDFVFEGPVTIGSAVTAGMFVENPQDVHVRYIYAMRPKTLLRPLTDLDTLPSEGAAILRLRRLPVEEAPARGEEAADGQAAADGGRGRRRGIGRWFQGRRREEVAGGEAAAAGETAAVEEPAAGSEPAAGGEPAVEESAAGGQAGADGRVQRARPPIQDNWQNLWRRWPWRRRYQRYLQGTYYSDKMRRGDIHLWQVSSKPPKMEGAAPVGDQYENAWADWVRECAPPVGGHREAGRAAG